MSAHPFPFPTGPEAAWTARQWQAAANFYHYEIMGVDRETPNYRPTLSLLESAHRHAQGRARLSRARGAA